MTFKPMLAATIKDTSALSYPLLASPKLDGIRCLILNGKAVTRNLKPIPNKFIRETLEGIIGLDGFDGEIMLKSGDFNSVQSAVMSEDGEPDFYYAVFDFHLMNYAAYSERLKHFSDKIKLLAHPRIVELEQIEVFDEEDMFSFERECLADGYEGVILRNTGSTYKYGRSTLREAKLMKLKRFDDDEATIVDCEQLMSNQNAAKTNALGHTERSSHKDNLVPQNKLGALVVELKNGKQFSIGTGFDDATRCSMWQHRKKLVGKKVKFKFQELSADGIPRFPVFLGMRDERDL